jgi:hypothetical protein
VPYSTGGAVKPCSLWVTKSDMRALNSHQYAVSSRAAIETDLPLRKAGQAQGFLREVVVLSGGGHLCTHFTGSMSYSLLATFLAFRSKDVRKLFGVGVVFFPVRLDRVLALGVQFIAVLIADAVAGMDNIAAEVTNRSNHSFLLSFCLDFGAGSAKALWEVFKIQNPLQITTF